MTLERQVDPPPPTVGATAGRMALSCMVGATAVAIAFVARPHDPPAPPPTPAAAPHITVTAPPPIVVNLETVVQSPITPAVVADGIGCPSLPYTDEPIGRPIAPSTIVHYEGLASATVKTAAAAPVLAAQIGIEVWVSEDDGRSWARAFENHGVETISVAPDGTVYALEDFTLGVRVRGGKTAWRDIPRACDESARCELAIGALGAEVVAFLGDQIQTSADRGKTWKSATNKDVTWEARSGADLYAFHGALYQVNHYQDMCGVDDYYTYRFDTQHAVAHDIFHNYYTGSDEPILEPANDVDTVWTWAEKCRVPDDATGTCQKRQPARRALMEAAMLSPREGARALALYRNSLIELCSAGVRQVYREFPFEHLDAVDASGRALVMNGFDLLRWSPSVGWRKVKTFAAAKPVDQDGE